MLQPLPFELEKLKCSMDRLWAKSPKENEEKGYPLFLHTLDVCFQTAEFYRRDRPSWPLGKDVKLRRVLAYAGLLHDFGKIHPKFQQALRPASRTRFDNRHEVLSLAFLRWLHVPEAELPWLQAGIAFHHRGYSRLFSRCGTHGDPLTSDYVKELAKINDADAYLLWQVLRHADTIFLHTGWCQTETYELREFAGGSWINYLAESIRSIQSFVPTFRRSQRGRATAPHDAAVVAAIAIRGILINADHLASFGKRQLTSAIVDREETVRQVAIKWTPSGHQRELLHTRGSACLVAPTGTGKTEAALFWAASQFETGEARGRLCFVLPYQAAMNAMQQRLLSRLDPASEKKPEAANELVALIHGRSARNLYEKLLEQQYEPPEAGQIARNGGSLARLHAAPIAIFSPYTMIRTLLSATPEPLLQAYSGARLIVDEIHAYEPEITALTLAAVRALSDRVGARALFMTATLPKHLRDSLSHALGKIADIKPGRDIAERPPRHWVRLLPFSWLDHRAEEMMASYAGKGSVLVVVNQVGRARQLATTLRKSGLSVRLLHSRFTQEDRLRKETQLKPQLGQVAVATQVVEVSLDLSFTYCFSELAPAESLLQRFGRCNRTGEIVPNTANCFIFREMPQGAKNAYRPYDQDHLQHLATVLSSRFNDQPIVESNLQEFIDDSYPTGMKDKLRASIIASLREIQNAIVDRFEPFGIAQSNTLADLEKRWEDLFDGQEVLPASLAEKARQEAHWMGRAKYLVAISSYLYRRLNPEFDDELNCDVVKAPYDPESGLDV